MKNIEFKVGIVPKTSEIIEVYSSSGIKRPTKDSERIAKMYANSNLIISVWLNDKLIGISRSITDSVMLAINRGFSFVKVEPFFQM